MIYVLLAMFFANPNQLAVMEDDYLTQKLMMALVNIEEVSKEELSLADLPNPTRKEPKRVYFDKMVFNKPSLGLTNLLKPINVIAYFERVPFKRVFIDGGQQLMCSHSDR